MENGSLKRENRPLRPCCWLTFHGWLFQRPLTLYTLLQKYRDTNGSRIVIQIGGDWILLSAKRKPYFCQSIVIETGGVSRYFYKVVDLLSSKFQWLLDQGLVSELALQKCNVG